MATQRETLLEAMKDGEWLTLEELSERTGIAEASVSAQLRNLRKPEYGAWEVEKRVREVRDDAWRRALLWEYRVGERRLFA